MRLWTLHPRYLDPRGLVALWREALLAQQVLGGGTRGYRAHPQLARFRDPADPGAAIATYLRAVHAEAVRRGYRFDVARILSSEPTPPFPETEGQLLREWHHLLTKLAGRSPQLYERYRHLVRPEPHPLFVIVPGPVAAWERARFESGSG